MVSGSLVMAWLCLAAGVAPVDVVYLKQRAIKIPLDIKATERPQIHQLTLFKSTDQGRTWQQEAVSSPDQDGFKFFAPSDGVYWFTVEVVDQHGRRSPEDVYKAPPSQKIVIDTLPPLVRLVKTERQGGDIVVAWEIQEDHPDLGSLRLEYRPADAPAESWYTAPLDPKLAGQTSFRLNNPAAVSVRLQLQDLAHNLGSAQAEVPGTSGVTPASLTSANAARAPVVPAVGSQSAGPSPTGGSLLPENLPTAPPVPEPPAKTGNDLPFAAMGTGSHESGNTSGTETGSRVAATSDSSANKTATASLSGPRSRHASLPALRVVKSTQVTLEYALDKVGPSGVGLVELWLTQDDGLTWRRYAEDTEIKQAMANGRYQRTVELPGEGVFGISLVVRSRAGLGKSPPRPGDPPQMRIEVDTTPPTTQLFVPTPDAHRRDALVITWTARDDNLAPNPITLQWAERKGGTWHTIGANLANSGRHLWQLPPNLPDRVYLRLVARDTAGNEGIAETAEPQLVDLNEPEGRIVGVVGPAGQP